LLKTNCYDLLSISKEESIFLSRSSPLSLNTHTEIIIFYSQYLNELLWCISSICGIS